MDANDINIEKLKKAMKSNKTFDVFIKICCQYNISIFEQRANGWVLRSNQSLLDECKKKRSSMYDKCMKGLSILMNANMDYVKEKWEIDNIILELKKGIKNMDLVCSLLKDVYDDKCLTKMTSEKTKTNRVVLIEHYSNST
jgi:hypothetical protein